MMERDRILLKKILNHQDILRAALNEFRISSPNKLSDIHVLVRRGMVQTVGDIFELTVPMSDDVLNQLPLQHDLIRQFRNIASHKYGEITNALAYMCIIHCIDKELMKIIRDLSGQ